VCGDGLVASNEACDDGNLGAGDGCDGKCQREPGFRCGGMPSICVDGVCGDGLIGPGTTCDDKNTIAGDGCGATCQIECGWSCQGVPSVCTELPGACPTSPGGGTSGGTTGSSNPAGPTAGSGADFLVGRLGGGCSCQGASPADWVWLLVALAGARRRPRRASAVC
jgi:MYXO-CTERM domain-containing protein